MKFKSADKIILTIDSDRMNAKAGAIATVDRPAYTNSLLNVIWDKDSYHQANGGYPESYFELLFLPGDYVFVEVLKNCRSFDMIGTIKATYENNAVVRIDGADTIVNLSKLRKTNIPQDFCTLAGPENFILIGVDIDGNKETKLYKSFSDAFIGLHNSGLYDADIFVKVKSVD